MSDQNEDIRELRKYLIEINETVTRIDEQLSGANGIQTRLRALEEKYQVFHNLRMKAMGFVLAISILVSVLGMKIGTLLLSIFDPPPKN